MSSSDDTRRQSAARARALLAGLDIQPSPDFEVQVFARVYALQARCASHPATHARPLPSQQPAPGWHRTCWRVRPWSRVPGRRTVACGLVVASAVLLWCVSTKMLPAVLPEGARQASTTLRHAPAPIEDRVDGSGRSAAALQEMVAAAEPVPEPSTLTPQPRETQTDEGDRAREEAHAVSPEAPLAAGFPAWGCEAAKLSAQAQEQRSGRHRGLHGKAKRSGKGLRLSRHAPA
jgi:hypothetical protein